MANTIMALSSLLLVIATIFYVVFTWRMVKEMQLARIADMRPYIVIDVRLFNQQFYLSIENRGKSPARNVKFKLDKNVEIRNNLALNQLPLLKDGIELLPSRKQFIIRLGATYKFLGQVVDGERRFPKCFTITVDYYYLGNKKTTESTVVNLEEYFLTHHDIDAHVESIKQLNEMMKEYLNIIAKGVDRLSGLANIAGPSGLEVSHRTASLFVDDMDQQKKATKFNLNLLTHADLVSLLSIDNSLSEKIIDLRFNKGGFESFDDLREINNMTEELINEIKDKTFISPSYLNRF